MKLVTHGGLCCGLRHIHGFDGPPEHQTDLLKDPVTKVPVLNATKNGYVLTGPTLLERFDAIIREQRGFLYEGAKYSQSKTFEVVLTDFQITGRYSGWLKVLQDRHFVLVNRVRNTTGAICNVFHQCPSRVTDPLPGWDYSKEPK